MNTRRKIIIKRIDLKLMFQQFVVTLTVLIHPCSEPSNRSTNITLAAALTYNHVDYIVRDTVSSSSPDRFTIYFKTVPVVNHLTALAVPVSTTGSCRAKLLPGGKVFHADKFVAQAGRSLAHEGDDLLFGRFRGGMSRWRGMAPSVSWPWLDCSASNSYGYQYTLHNTIRREIEKSWKRVIARISYGSQKHIIIEGDIEKSWKRVIARISYGPQFTQHIVWFRKQ